MPEFSIQRTAGEPEGRAGAKGRTKPPKATLKPYTRHRLRSTELPQSHSKATLKPHQGYTKATPRLHQGHTKATPMRRSSHPAEPQPAKSGLAGRLSWGMVGSLCQTSPKDSIVAVS